MNNNLDLQETDKVQQTFDDQAQSFDPQKEMKKKKRKKTIKKWFIRGIILIILIFAGIFTLHFFTKKKEAQIEKTPLDKVSRREITDCLSGTGTLEPINSYTINALVAGEILEAPFEEGDIVKEDSLMFRIDSSSIESSIERAQIGVERAQNSYDELLESLEDMTIYSDYSGTVQQFDLEIGDRITANTVIAQVVDKETMICTAVFFESDANSFNIGDSATLFFDGGQQSLEGSVKKVSSISYVNSAGSAVKDVEIAVTNPGSLTEQSFATAQVNGLACNEGGNLKYNVSKNIVSRASGEIAQIAIAEGQKISKGQLVLMLDSSATNTQLKNSELSLKDAQSSLKSVIDQKDDYEITAPISGTVIEKNYEAGEVIDKTSGGTLAIIYDMSALKFTLNVDELDIPGIEVGQKVSVTCDAFEGETYFGQVSKVSVQGSSVNGTTSYPVTVIMHDTGALKPGMNVDAEIILYQKEAVLSVPADAVSRGNIVKVVAEDSEITDTDQQIKTMPDGVRYREVVVELGINNDDYVEVVSGLNDGDKIIVNRTEISSFSMFGITGSGGMGAMGAMGGMGQSPAGSVPGGMSGGPRGMR